jgi:glycosyltransferase involved in cell wall biosynthesis
VALDPAVVHLHDPELIPWGLALRAARRCVIYDVHEDYSSALRVRPWMPDWTRSTAALLWNRLEQLLGRGMVLVLAERYYAERFPRATLILNYPQVDEALTQAPLAYQRGSRRLLYTGNHTANRGAEIHARLVSRNPDVCLTSVGHCSEELAGRMRALAGNNAGHLELDGVGSYVTFDRIRARYVEGGWLAGLALFPRSDHYDRKELTKFYEYMLAGLPILASDSPVWREIVEGNRVGLCVDPADDGAVDQALAWLRSHPEDAADMAARGRQLAVERYGWASQGESLVELYDSLV